MPSSYVIEQYPAGYRYSNTHIAVNVKFRATEFSAAVGQTAVYWLYMGFKITRKLWNGTTEVNTYINEIQEVMLSSVHFQGPIYYMTPRTESINDNCLITAKFTKEFLDSVFDVTKYEYIEIQLLGGFAGGAMVSLAWYDVQGGRQYLLTQTTNNSIKSTKSDSFRKTIDDMTLEEFRRIAADRLQCKPEQVRTFTKIITAYHDTTEGRKKVKITELKDNTLTTAYIQRINAVVNEEEVDGMPSISLTDNFNGEQNDVYYSEKGDLSPTAVGYFADEITISGQTAVQAIVLIAERLI